MSSSTAETVNALTSDLQCKLWNHRLRHPGKESLRSSSTACDEIPNLHRYPIFQCSNCIKAKFHKHKKGHHDKNSNTNPVELLQMYYVFVRGKKYSSAELDQHPSREEQPNPLPLKPCINEHNCYLLVTDVCTRHVWVFPFADNNLPMSTVN